MITPLCRTLLYKPSLYIPVKQLFAMSKALSPRDPSSFSRPELAFVSNIFINLNVNFDRKVLTGTVHLTVKKVEESAKEVILDTLKLNITSIYDVETKQKLQYTLEEPVPEYGSKLSISFPNQNASEFKIGIDYETDPEASGLQWLPPSATAGKEHPYLFSQFQPTHARSVLPCQDTPAVKSKYNATISAPAEFTVLMSAIRTETKELPQAKLTHFVQDVPMPSYLIAIAVGVLESRKLGPRSHVWAEKEIIEECAYEFANTEHQLQTAEAICGPYVWGIYDLLVLPPSFPYGGMENPCLTFVTPTLLAGDRSLANVVAHEIAHSWTGNLITNRNFEHFWLNEGFTVFVERKIKGRLESPESQDFDAYTHVSDLKDAIERIGVENPLTQLVVNLDGVHPDEAFSVVPYEKGQTFLRYLEETVGGPSKFEPFLKDYFEAFKYKSIDTNDFKKFFLDYFASVDAVKSIDWEQWLYKPGMPPVIPDYNKSLALVCDDLIDKFLAWFPPQPIPISEEDRNRLSTNQIIYILQKLVDCPAQTVAKLKELEKVFGLNEIRNAEIKFRWLRICLKAKWQDKVEPTLAWINVVGRMKFVRPLYRDLYAWDKTRSLTVKNYKANKQNMMHVSAFTLAKDLHLD